MAGDRSTHSPAVYVIAGKDQALVDAQCEELIDQLLSPEQRRTGLYRFDSDSVRISDVLDELRTMPFLSDRRVVVVKKADDFISKNRPLLERYFDSPCRTAVLVLTVTSWNSQTKLAKKLRHIGQLIQVEQPKSRHLPQRIIKYAAEVHDKKLPSADAELLVELVGDDLQRLYHELDKLALYVGSRKTITTDDIEALIGHNRLFNAFAVIDATLAGQADQAVQRLRAMFAQDRSAEYTVVGAFAFHLRRMFAAKKLIKQGLAPANVLKQLQIWSNKEAFLACLRRVSLHQIATYLLRLAELDHAIKTGRASAAIAMEQLTLQLAADSSKQPQPNHQ